MATNLLDDFDPFEDQTSILANPFADQTSILANDANDSSKVILSDLQPTIGGETNEVLSNDLQPGINGETNDGFPNDLPPPIEGEHSNDFTNNLEPTSGQPNLQEQNEVECNDVKNSQAIESVQQSSSVEGMKKVRRGLKFS